MKLVQFRIPLCLFAVAVGLWSISSSWGATLYFDKNGTTAGSGVANNGSYTWDTTTSEWNNTSSGTGGTRSAWVAGTGGTDTPVFSAGTDATGAYTVTIANSTSVSVNGLTFAYGNVTIGAGNASSTLYSNGGTFQVASTAGTSANETIASAFSLNTAGVTILLASAGQTLTISGAISDGATARSITVGGSGAGTLVLAGANTWNGGLTLNANYTLDLNNANALGTTTPGRFTIVGGTIDNTSSRSQGSDR